MATSRRSLTQVSMRGNTRLGYLLGNGERKGLPIDRCPVDHGTAFDIAGTGKSNHGNMLATLDSAVKLAAAKRKITA